MGTGTGIWALDFADLFPSAHVLGTDLSPIQPEWVPPNCEFMVDDLESDWFFIESFDFIHGRTLAGSIKDWGRLCRQAYNHLKQEGWLELQEYEWVLFSDSDFQFKRAPFLNLWQSAMYKATITAGQKLDVASQLKGYLRRARFVDVYDDVQSIPCGGWSQDRELKKIGICQLEHLLDAIEPYTLAIFTRVLGWSLQETRILIAHVKHEIRKMQNHLYLIVHFVYGRKPSV